MFRAFCLDWHLSNYYFGPDYLGSYDRVEGTFDRAYLATKTTMHVNKRGFVAINTDDGFGLTNLLG